MRRASESVGSAGVTAAEAGAPIAGAGSLCPCLIEGGAGGIRLGFRRDRNPLLSSDTFFCVGVVSGGRSSIGGAARRLLAAACCGLSAGVLSVVVFKAVSREAGFGDGGSRVTPPSGTVGAPSPFARRRVANPISSEASSGDPSARADGVKPPSSSFETCALAGRLARSSNCCRLGSSNASTAPSASTSSTESAKSSAWGALSVDACAS